jgi:hypothetical protein
MRGGAEVPRQWPQGFKSLKMNHETRRHRAPSFHYKSLSRERNASNSSSSHLAVLFLFFVVVIIKALHCVFDVLGSLVIF